MLFVRARSEPPGNREALFVAWPRTSRITASRRQRAIRLVDPAVGGDEKLKFDKIRDPHRRRCFCHLPVCSRIDHVVVPDEAEVSLFENRHDLRFREPSLLH
jgi:hypothetical protein